MNFVMLDGNTDGLDCFFRFIARTESDP